MWNTQSKIMFYIKANANENEKDIYKAHTHTGTQSKHKYGMVVEMGDAKERHGAGI